MWASMTRPTLQASLPVASGQKAFRCPDTPSEVRNMNDAVILVGCVGIVVVACVVHRLRPAQRLVVLVGAVALVVQVFCPPCVYPDGTTARRWMPAGVSYFPGGGSPLVDAGQQAIWMTVTVAVVVAACAVLECRHRSKRVGGQQSPLTSRPAHG